MADTQEPQASQEQPKDYTLTPYQENRGRLAYARYSVVVETTWDGRPLPTWDEMTPKIRKGWSNAGLRDDIPALRVTFRDGHIIFIEQATLTAAGGLAPYLADKFPDKQLKELDDILINEDEREWLPCLGD